ncbi:hypothetical protein GBA52_016794 [Prunus armeniaca]|nr:hypothetical protein GBA52_016794 [Prunus armeniaca]
MVEFFGSIRAILNNFAASYFCTAQKKAEVNHQPCNGDTAKQHKMIQKMYVFSEVAIDQPLPCVREKYAVKHHPDHRMTVDELNDIQGH